MIAVLKHEIRSYYHSLIAYLYCAFILCFVGIGAMIYNIQAAVANFEYVLSLVSIGLVVIIPVLTMKSISEEKKQKTDQLLYSLPIKTSDIVLGKFFALFIVFMIPMVVIAVYPLIFSHYGDVYLPTSYGCLVAFILMSAAIVAFGIFVSSLTENQGFAAGISIPLLLFNYYSVSLAEYVSANAVGAVIGIVVVIAVLGLLIKFLTKSNLIAGCVSAVCFIAVIVVYLVDSSKFENLLPNVMSKLSLFDRFSTFVNGVFDLTSIVFYLTVIVFFLFLTVQSLEKRRYN